MNKRIVYISVDGMVCIVCPAAEYRLEGESDVDFFNRVAIRSVPDGLPYRVIDASEVPTDRTFRDAWTPDLAVDMAKARAITRDRMRSERSPLFTALDKESLRAMETGDAARLALIAAEKQKLRDAPAMTEIEAAKTPEELKAISLPTPAI